LHTFDQSTHHISTLLTSHHISTHSISPLITSVHIPSVHSSHQYVMSVLIECVHTHHISTHRMCTYVSHQYSSHQYTFDQSTQWNVHSLTDRMCAKEPRMLIKCVYAITVYSITALNQTYTQFVGLFCTHSITTLNETYTHSTISIRALCAALRPPYLQKSPTNLQKSPVHLQKSPTHPQKSPMYTRSFRWARSRSVCAALGAVYPQKSPVILQKSPAHPRKGPVYTKSFRWAHPRSVCAGLGSTSQMRHLLIVCHAAMRVWTPPLLRRAVSGCLVIDFRVCVRGAVWRNQLQCVAAWCSVLQCVAPQC